ncbi:hypothetical protein L249_6659 [Ophiocordyceps polyrhachis-furcata BCC 54312]|uniref:Peroxidase n=1 Tax=Ophiocordyceps polyrhachis-furcata BCC 54312 TaxID=1330021 RepID=A0A367LKX2_9HYPO|nr:hypothetical protein L249_6659 [Ophiocordyceps polyrhachis-furcata BCC 54312]
MKNSASLIAALAGISSAFPAMEEVVKLAGKRQAPSTELLGDLTTLQDSQLTQTGKDIKSILRGTGSGIDAISTAGNVPPKESTECAQDPCCIWKYIADDMHSAMIDSNQQCNDLAHGSIRLGFHDAWGWSKTTGPAGGADGSIVLAGECESRPDNSNLKDTCNQMRTWFSQYQQFGIQMADLIQMGANVATVSCPLGPRVRSFVGRNDSSQASPRDDLPRGNDTADTHINSFAERTFTPENLVALVGAHGTGRQRTIAARANDAFDSTPGVWDTAFYGEVLDPNAPSQVFKLPSDVSISQDTRTKQTWNTFVGPQGQQPWDAAYATAYVRMSVLGVQNINGLTECTKVLPPFIQSPPAGKRNKTGNLRRMQ